MKKLLAIFTLSVILGCQSIRPTVLLYGELRNLNTYNIELYQACTEDLTFIPEKPGCEREELEVSLEKTISLAELAISKDIKQTFPYIIDLEMSMIYGRVSEKTEGLFYTKTEQVSRQFFEVQKATSKKALSEASFYLAYNTAVNASYQSMISPELITPSRKQELLFALDVGRAALPTISSERKRRLADALTILELLSQEINNY